MHFCSKISMCGKKIQIEGTIHLQFHNIPLSISQVNQKPTRRSHHGSMSWVLIVFTHKHLMISVYLLHANLIKMLGIIVYCRLIPHNPNWFHGFSWSGGADRGLFITLSHNTMQYIVLWDSTRWCLFATHKGRCP